MIGQKLHKKEESAQNIQKMEKRKSEQEKVYRER